MNNISTPIAVTDKLAIAQDYINRGYSVIPIVQRTKRAAVAWKDYTTRYATQSELYLWYRVNNYDIAIVTGQISNLTVIDVDDCDTYNRLAEQLSLPLTPTVKTRRGYHLYFNYIHTPCKINREIKIDIKGENGYVIAPPSLYAEGNGNYEFIVPLETTTKIDCPANLLEYIARQGHSQSNQGKTLVQLIDGIALAAEGERNDVLFRNSCQAIRLAKEQKEDMLLIIDKLVYAGVLSGLSHKESSTTVASAYKHVINDTCNTTAKATAKVYQKDIVELIVDEYKDVLRYATDRQLWYLYNDTYWQQICDEEINNIIIDVCSTAMPNYTIATVNSIRSLLSCHETMRISINDFDKYHNIIAFANGVVDISDTTLSLLPHSAHYYNTSCLPYDFDKNAQCPAFTKYLKDVFSDAVATFVLQYIGLCFTSDTRFETALFLYSDVGGAGKSTLLNVIQSLLGEKCGLLPINKLGERFGKMSLIGKTAILATETSSEMLQNCDVLNSIISGESILIEPKHKEAFSYRPFAKLIYASNNLPKVSATDGAFYGLYRRLKIIKMEPIPQHKRDIYLRDKLEQELSGIAVLALQNLQQLYKQGKFAVIPEIEKETHQWSEESNSVVQFLNEMCICGEGVGDESNTRLYFAYRQYCKESGYCPVSKAVMSRQLKRLNYDQIVKNVNGTTNRCWRNITVRPDIVVSSYTRY